MNVSATESAIAIPVVLAKYAVRNVAVGDQFHRAGGSPRRTVGELVHVSGYHRSSVEMDVPVNANNGLDPFGQSGDIVTDLTTLVKGLNYLVTGSADASEGLVVPEPAS